MCCYKPLPRPSLWYILIHATLTPSNPQLYTVKLSVARSFVLAADMFNSVSLLRYQEEEKTFSLITRDFSKIPLFTSAYVVDDTTLAAMVTDMDGNVQVFGYAPDGRCS
ncbi:hypothetical protein SARC_17288 [Sphaeroforma arctica JP610]|uniref:RSE1/DDB1/CPSF1 C-terminal domain-containing protein n=1 Tax=Sphaeroforma arctica JP610 TaxID=667725 RepID=A0A0L0F0E6_9EUKA|nr:hypothetical protein SARC_17288 [Sphaeroforma arctica JP610]KNC70187.1 hypothetical protein SARC_17288 [Sphaeroforma arctica JP610]|eukprot:XP_014144089.1 hypothetical protein SARC_17288 [Sphaeroforma arctica JP610]